MIFALLDGQRIKAVITDDIPPEGPHAILPSWDGPPANPNRGDTLMLIDGEIVWQDTRTLAQVKAARIAAMRDARDAAIEAGFEWDGSPFDADQVAQSRMLGAAFAATGPGFDSVAWRLADNTWRELSAGDVIAVYAALQTHLRAAFARFAELEAEIMAVEAGPAALAAVDAIAWDEPD